MLLSSSSKFGQSTSENLLKFFAEIDQENSEKKLRKELAQLARLRNTLKSRSDILKTEINKSLTKKEEIKPLSEINKEANFDCSAVAKDAEIKDIQEEQKLEAYKYAFGVEISARDSERIVFDLTPISSGVISQDVYQVCLTKINPGLALSTAYLPAPNSLETKYYDFETIRKAKKFSKTEDDLIIVPIQDLADTYLPKVDQFLQALKKHLEAYVSRFDQIAVLPELFPDEEVHDIDYNGDLTEVKFSMALGESDGNEDEGVFIRLALLYDHGENRPKENSLKIKFLGRAKEQLDQTAFDELKSQCHVFYSHSISDAIRVAFLSEN